MPVRMAGNQEKKSTLEYAVFRPAYNNVEPECAQQKDHELEGASRPSPLPPLEMLRRLYLIAAHRENGSKVADEGMICQSKSR